VITTYEQFSRREQRDSKCPVCGRYVRRSTTFTETMSPFNRNADGKPKDIYEITASLEEKAKAWEPDFRHEACRD
jgi:hypothetical protein